MGFQYQTNLKYWDKQITGYRSYLMIERSFSENTVEAYLRDIRKMVVFLKEKQLDIPPESIDRKHLQQFIEWIAESNLSANSQTRIISGIRAFYKYLLIEDVINDDPTTFMKRPKLERKIPEVLSVEEVQQILEIVDLSTTYGVRNRAMLETLYACGLRVTELISLQLSNLFLDVGFIKVIGKNDRERIVPIGEEAIKHIQLYIKGVRQNFRKIEKKYEDILFLNHRGRQLTRVMIFKIVKDATKKAGLTKTVSPHTFRHSFATHLVEGGADLRAIQDMLGHESITTTEIYTHMDKEYLRETILLYHPRSKPKQQQKEI